MFEGASTLNHQDIFTFTHPSDGVPDIQKARQDEVTPCNRIGSAVPRDG